MKIIKKYKKYIIALLSILIITSLIILKIQLNKNTEIIKEESNELFDVIPLEEDNIKENKKVSVDIKGAVINPGVYEIEDSKKVIDVINLAGGLKEDANTSLINLAKKVTDEMVVIIYTEKEIKEAMKQENNLIKPIDNTCNCPKITNDACLTKESDAKDNTSSNNTTPNSNTPDKNTKININTASLEELETLSGIGESKAKAIIEYREEVGKFEKIEDIKNVSGIGDSAYEKIKNFITV